MTGKHKFRGLCGLSAAVLATIALLGCAKVSIQKVPSPAQYGKWSDDKQEQVDAIRGFRYYLPRPYVVVKKPFAVGGREYVVSGKGAPDGSSVTISADAIPAELRDIFKLTADTGQLASATMAVPDAGPPETTPPRVQQAQTTTTDARAIVDPTNLKGTVTNTTTPSILQQSEQSATVTVTLSKGAPYTGVVKSSVKVVLLPIDSAGTVDVKKPVLFTTRAATDYTPTSADGVYTADVRRSDLTGAADYAAGLELTGIQPPGTSPELLLIFNSNSVLHVLGATPPKPAEKPNPQTTEETEVQPKTKASVVTSGDPRTDPLTKLDAPFDILLLPDMDEQYAISVSGGLGTASSKIGFENGWMVETADTQVDNRELGKFVFEQINKFTDIAAEASKLALGIPPVLGGAAPRVQQAAREGKPVLLRVLVYEEAEPGLYPVLKSRETLTHRRFLATDVGNEQDFADERGCTLLPYRPYTVVAFDTIRRVTIQVLNPAATPKDDGTKDAEVSWKITPDDSTAMAAVTALIKRVKTKDDQSQTIFESLKEALHGEPEKFLKVYVQDKALIFRLDTTPNQDLVKLNSDALRTDFQKFKSLPDNDTSETSQQWNALFKAKPPPLSKTSITSVQFQTNGG